MGKTSDIKDDISLLGTTLCTDADETCRKRCWGYHALVFGRIPMSSKPRWSGGTHGYSTP